MNSWLPALGGRARSLCAETCHCNVLQLALTSWPSARQEQSFRHSMHRIVYLQHCQTYYSGDGGMPAYSICKLFPRMREQGPVSDQNQNSCTESRNHNTALTCLQNNNNISHVHCASLLQYKHTEGNLNYKLNCS